MRVKYTKTRQFKNPVLNPQQNIFLTSQKNHFLIPQKSIPEIRADSLEIETRSEIYPIIVAQNHSLLAY